MTTGELKDIGLDVPTAYKISQDLKNQGIELSGDIFTALDLERAIVKYYNNKNDLQLDYGKLPQSELAKGNISTIRKSSNAMNDIFGQEGAK